MDGGPHSGSGERGTFFLCDRFFELGVEPPGVDVRPRGSCIGVRDNQFIGFGHDLLLFQKYTLIHEYVESIQVHNDHSVILQGNSSVIHEGKG